MSTAFIAVSKRIAAAFALTVISVSLSAQSSSAKDPKRPVYTPPITAQPFNCGEGSAIVKEVHDFSSMDGKWLVHAQTIHGASGVDFTNFYHHNGVTPPPKDEMMHLSYRDVDGSRNNVTIRFRFELHGQKVVIDKPMNSFSKWQESSHGMLAARPEFKEVWGDREGTPRLHGVTVMLDKPGKIDFGRTYVVDRIGSSDYFYYANTVIPHNGNCGPMK